MSAQNLTTDQTNIRELVDLIISGGVHALGGNSKCIVTFAIMRNFKGIEEDLRRGCYFFIRTFCYNDVEYLFVPNVNLSIMCDEGAFHGAEEIIFVTLRPTLSIERYILHPRKTLRKLECRQYLKYGEADTDVFNDFLKDGQLVFQFDYRTFRLPVSVYADSVAVIDERVAKRKAENPLYNKRFDNMLYECVTSGFGGRHQMLVRAKLFGKAYETMFNL